MCSRSASIRWRAASATASTTYNLLEPRRTHFVGLGNYVDLLGDPEMRHALVNTALFTVAAVTIELGARLPHRAGPMARRPLQPHLSGADPHPRHDHSARRRPHLQGPAARRLRPRRLLARAMGAQQPARPVRLDRDRAADAGLRRCLGMDAADGADPARRSQGAAGRSAGSRRRRRRDRPSGACARSSCR